MKNKNKKKIFSLDRMKREFVEKETELCTQFEAKIEEIKRKCADDLTSHRNEMKAKLKKEYGM